MRVLVVDGMGGSIGSQIISRIRAAFPEEAVEIVALGTNAVAASNMMKAGANRGASGENAFRVTAPNADIIIGPVGAAIPNSFMGELSPAMAEAISLSPALKLLFPLTQSGVEIVGASGLPLPHLMDRVIELIDSILKQREVKERV